MGIIVYVIIIMAVIFALLKGKGKEKIWSLALIGIYVLLAIIEEITSAIIPHFIDIEEMSYSPPIELVYSLVNIIVLVGSSFWVIRRIQRNKLKRIENKIESSNA
jgi:hypothetical protein